MQIYLIPKHQFLPELVEFLKENPVTELNEIEYYVSFDSYQGIIFHIPEEDIYGIEMCWENGVQVLIRFGAYTKELNQLLTKLEKEYEDHLKFYQELLK